MALTKDRTLVWISDVSRSGRRTITLMAYPASRKKDLETRLKTMASKKVRGQKLEYLSYDLLDEGSAPFVKDYLLNLFRISDLVCAQASIFEKGNLAEQAGLDYLAHALKEAFEGSVFDLIFDSRHLKKSVLSRWMKKNQIPGTAVEASIQENRMLQTTTLLSMLGLAGNSDEYGLSELLMRQYSMSPGWARLEAEELYLEQIKDQADRQAAAQLIRRVPALLESGRFESWLKKQPDPGVFVKTMELFLQGMPEESLLALNLKKINDNYDLLKEQLANAQKPLDENLLSEWIDQVSQAARNLTGQLDLRIELPSFVHPVRKILDRWIENPLDKKYGFKPCTFVCRCGEDFKLVTTRYRLWLETDFEYFETQELYDSCTCSKEELFETLWKLNSSRILVEPEVFESVRAQSVLKNRYLPLSVIDQKEKKTLSSLKLTISSQCQQKEAGPKQHGWFSEMISDYLDENQREFLAKMPFSLMQTRQLARSFTRGLPLFQAEERTRDLDHLALSVYRLCAPYLFLPKQQRFLDTLKEDWEVELIAHDSYSLAQMSAIDRLIDRGLDPDWIACNLKGKTTVRQIQALAGTYPMGKIPWNWNTLVVMPDLLADWLIQQAISAHPQLKEKEVRRSLAMLCQTLFEQLFSIESHLFSSSAQDPS